MCWARRRPTFRRLLAETIPAKLSSTTKQSVGARSVRSMSWVSVGPSYLAGMPTQCSQGEPVAFGVRLTLRGVLGRDDHRDLIEPIRAASKSTRSQLAVHPEQIATGHRAAIVCKVSAAAGKKRKP